MEFSQGLRFEYGEMSVWLEEADDVFFTQGVNVRHACIIASLATLQNVEGRKFGLNLWSVPQDFCLMIQPRM
jgi:hypothetical protein